MGPTRAARVVRLMRRWGLTYRTAVRVQHLLESHAGLKITSGRRGVAHNKAVGGARNSRHLRGTAVDLVGPASGLSDARAHARRSAAVEVLDEGDHTHLAWLD